MFTRPKGSEHWTFEIGHLGDNLADLVTIILQDHREVNMLFQPGLGMPDHQVTLDDVILVFFYSKIHCPNNIYSILTFADVLQAARRAWLTPPPLPHTFTIDNQSDGILITYIDGMGQEHPMWFGQGLGKIDQDQITADQVEAVYHWLAFQNCNIVLCATFNHVLQTAMFDTNDEYLASFAEEDPQ